MTRSVLVHTAILAGVAGRPLTISVDVHPSLPLIARRDDAIVRQALHALRSLDVRCVDVPDVPFTLEMLPETPSTISSADLAIALALLAAHDKIPADALTNIHVLGRLMLDATIEPVRGVLPILQTIRRDDRPLIVLMPRASLVEAQLVDDVALLPADSLSEAITQLRQPTLPAPTRAAPITIPEAPRDPHLDVLDIPPYIRTALNIAAAGGHHLLLMGPHGSHTTWLARRLHALLPPPTPSEALTITTHASAAGLLPPTALITTRPFRAPHHTVSKLAMLGAGPNTDVRPGELALAHHGVLLLDELPEFARSTLDAIAYHVLQREVSTQRHGHAITMPVSTLLVATMTPCPCGRRGHPDFRCLCTPDQIARYQARLDARCRQLFNLVLPVIPRTIYTDTAPHREDVTTRLARIARARTRRAARPSDFQGATQLTPGASGLLEAALAARTLEPDDRHRVVDIALTIADLADADCIIEADIEQALAYRLPARKNAHTEHVS